MNRKELQYKNLTGEKIYNYLKKYNFNIFKTFSIESPVFKAFDRMAVFRYKITNIEINNDHELKIYYQYNINNKIINDSLAFDFMDNIVLKILKYKNEKYIAITYPDGFLGYFSYVLIVTDVDDFNLNKLLMQITI